MPVAHLNDTEISGFSPKLDYRFTAFPEVSCQRWPPSRCAYS
jgi:hypothetical protein